MRFNEYRLYGAVAPSGQSFFRPTFGLLRRSRRFPGGRPSPRTKKRPSRRRGTGRKSLAVPPVFRRRRRRRHSFALNAGKRGDYPPPRSIRAASPLHAPKGKANAPGEKLFPATKALSLHAARHAPTSSQLVDRGSFLPTIELYHSKKAMSIEKTTQKSAETYSKMAKNDIALIEKVCYNITNIIRRDRAPCRRAKRRSKWHIISPNRLTPSASIF